MKYKSTDRTLSIRFSRETMERVLISNGYVVKTAKRIVLDNFNNDIHSFIKAYNLDKVGIKSDSSLFYVKFGYFPEEELNIYTNICTRFEDYYSKNINNSSASSWVPGKYFWFDFVNNFTLYNYEYSVAYNRLVRDKIMELFNLSSDELG